MAEGILPWYHTWMIWIEHGNMKIWQWSLQCDILARHALPSKILPQTLPCPVRRVCSCSPDYSCQGAWQVLWSVVKSLVTTIYSLQKQVSCFNHRVVTMVADKLKIEWLYHCKNKVVILAKYLVTTCSCVTILTMKLYECSAGKDSCSRNWYLGKLY